MNNAFECSGLEEIALPSTLKEVQFGAFGRCADLGIVYVREGCDVSLSHTGIARSTDVYPIPSILFGRPRVWDLRKQRDVVIPEGTEKIGKKWFWGADVESVMIPASVKEIGTDAFRYCKQLKCVSFAEGSRLEKLGASCFSKSGLEKIAIPKGVKELQKSIFSDC